MTSQLIRPAEWSGKYWCEGSGATEYLLTQGGAVRCPAIYATSITGGEDIEIIDEYHYTRPFGTEGERFKKVILIFDDKAVYEKVIERFKEQHNNTIDFVLKGKGGEIIKGEPAIASYVIGQISENLCEMGMTELISTQSLALRKALESIRKYPEYNDAGQTIELGEYILDTYPILELHQFT